MHLKAIYKFIKNNNFSFRYADMQTTLV